MFYQFATLSLLLVLVRAGDLLSELDNLPFVNLQSQTDSSKCLAVVNANPGDGGKKVVVKTCDEAGRSAEWKINGVQDTDQNTVVISNAYDKPLCLTAPVTADGEELIVKEACLGDITCAYGSSLTRDQIWKYTTDKHIRLAEEAGLDPILCLESKDDDPQATGLVELITCQGLPEDVGAAGTPPSQVWVPALPRTG